MEIVHFHDTPRDENEVPSVKLPNEKERIHMIALIGLIMFAVSSYDGAVRGSSCGGEPALRIPAV